MPISFIRSIPFRMASETFPNMNISRRASSSSLFKNSKGKWFSPVTRSCFEVLHGLLRMSPKSLMASFESIGIPEFFENQIGEALAARTESLGNAHPQSVQPTHWLTKVEKQPRSGKWDPPTSATWSSSIQRPKAKR
jgi:hypothetical protein